MDKFSGDLALMVLFPLTVFCSGIYYREWRVVEKVDINGVWLYLTTPSMFFAAAIYHDKLDVYRVCDDNKIRFLLMQDVFLLIAVIVYFIFYYFLTLIVAYSKISSYFLEQEKRKN